MKKANITNSQKEKQIILTRKVEIYIVEPEAQKRKEGYKTLRDYAYHSRHMANDMMSIFASDSFIQRLNKENEVQTNTLQESFVSSQQNLGYKITTEKYFELLPSNIRASLSQKVNKDFKNNIKDVLSGKRSFNSYKQDIPIYFMKNSIINLSKISDDKNFSFSLFKLNFKTRLGRDKSNNETIIDNILNGTYTLCDSSIQFKDNKLFLNTTFKQKFQSQQDKLDVNKVLGVDLGIVFPAYCSVFGTKEKRAIGNKQDFLNQRLKIYSRRRMLHKNLEQTAGGKGRQQKLKKLDHLSQTERNFAHTYNHYISKQVVDMALQNGCGTVNIEKLEGIARDEKNKFILRNWSYHELVSMIKYKAEKHGILVNEVDAAFTSQRCSKCGHIHSDNRVEQDKFLCIKCGFTENADYNASQNISIAHTKDFIEQIHAYKKWTKENKEEFDLEESAELIENKKIKKVKNKFA